MLIGLVVSHSLWQLNKPDFLLQGDLEPWPSASTVTVHRAGVGQGPLLNIDLDQTIDS